MQAQTIKLQPLADWQRAYTTLTNDLRDCTASYSCFSGRQFHIPSTFKDVPLSSLEERVLATLRSGKQAIENSLDDVFGHIQKQRPSSKKEPNVEDCQHIYEELTEINQFREVIFLHEFLNLRETIVNLDKNSDRDFYASQPSILLRIALWICRLFSNLFKSSHESFRGTLESAQLKAAGYSVETGLFSPNCPYAELQKKRALFTSYIFQQSLRHPDKVELKDIFDLLVPPTEHTFFGVPFTSDEISYLERNRDGFFETIKKMSPTSSAGPIFYGSSGNINEDYICLSSQYSFTENTEHYPPLSIRLKFSLVIEKAYWLIQGRVEG